MRSCQPYALCLFFLFSFTCQPVLSSTTLGNIPEELKAWVPWVKARNSEKNCTPYESNNKLCVWPSPLSFTASEHNASFEQHWQLLAPATIRLPGNEKYWPIHVKVNDKYAEVITNSGFPALKLDEGVFTLSGEFSWSNIPQHINIPPETALATLNLNGNTVHHYNPNGTLWLQNKTTQKTSEKENVRLEVFRVLTDDEPMTLTTVVQLNVSGSAREIPLTGLVLSNTKTLAIESPIPLKIDENGNAVLRARAGQWEVTHHARLLTPKSRFMLPTIHKPWPQQELWGFVANPALRQISLSGALPIDWEQVEVPSFFDEQGYGDFPLFLLEPSAQLTLEEKQRGKRSGTNQLSLKRDLWLHFDGKNATFKDTITGQLEEGNRLNALDSLRLKSADIDGGLVINEYDGAPGIEIRDSNLQLSAMGNIDFSTQLPANGWSTQFDNAQLTIHLPPGYKAWHLGGADYAQHTWLSRWDLWSIFITVLIAGTLFKLFGFPLGAIALITGLLTYHSYNTVFWLAAPLCLLFPLLKALPTGKLRTVTQFSTAIWCLILLINLIGFSIDQLRSAIYPQLEAGTQYRPTDHFLSNAAPIETNIQKAQEPRAFYDESHTEEVIVTGIRQSKKRSYINELKTTIDSNNFTQTGPAEPEWLWRKATAGWQGGLLPEQTLSFVYTGPLLTRLYYLLSALFTIILFLGLLRHFFKLWPSKNHNTNKNSTGPQVTASFITLCLTGLIGTTVLPQTSHANSYPSPELLDELEKRILSKPSCMPHCTAINSVIIKTDKDQLHLHLMVSAAEASAFPLPKANGWREQAILFNEKPIQAITQKNNTTYAQLPKGNHHIHLSARATANTININFLNTAHNISLANNEWQTASGTQHIINSPSLSLERTQGKSRQEQWGAPEIAPFIKVIRYISWDTQWTIDTEVERIAPSTGSITVKLPLITGEKVMSDNYSSDNSSITITLDGDQEYTSWQSHLDIAPSLSLNYTSALHHTEEWHLDADERWHVITAGLPALSDDSGSLFTWRPRPGESVILEAAKPKPATGERQTINRLNHTISHGKRFVKHHSEIDITASTGGSFNVTLPEGAHQTAFSLNGDELLLEQEELSPSITLRPGSNRLSVKWQMPRQSAFSLSAPALLLPIRPYNITTTIHLNRDRWPLWIWGPSLGPAMLYWGVLATLLLSMMGLHVMAKKIQLSAPITLGSWILLGIGISSLHAFAAIIIAGWFFLLEAKKRYANKLSPKHYNLTQVATVIYTGIALLLLFVAIPHSLLAEPDMQVAGNSSDNYYYRWYVDYHTHTLPNLGVWHVSLWVYRVVMLAWSLWLVFALLRWAKWFWQSFTQDGLWREVSEISGQRPKVKKENNSGS